MSRAVTRIHKGKQPRRPHYIQEWAERRGYANQAALVAAIDGDKSLVSRWYNGTSPGDEWQKALADLFGVEPESLFRHPDDDWLAKMFRDRTAEEVARMKQMLEAAFPPSAKVSRGGK